MRGKAELRGICYDEAMPRMSPIVRYWLRSAREDLRIARTLLSARHYRMAIFCCHLAVEKGLKAILQNQTGVMPPKTHNLRLLLRRTGLTAPARLNRFISQISTRSVPTRYPGALSLAPVGVRKRDVEDALRRGQEVLEWCKKNC